MSKEKVFLVYRHAKIVNREMHKVKKGTKFVAPKQADAISGEDCVNAIKNNDHQFSYLVKAFKYEAEAVKFIKDHPAYIKETCDLAYSDKKQDMYLAEAKLIWMDMEVRDKSKYTGSFGRGMVDRELY